MNEEIIYNCDKSELMRLDPANGGFRFYCEDKTSVYFMYNTTEAKDGSIKYMSYDVLENGKISTRSLIPAVYSSKRGTINCETAKALNKDTGEPPLPLSINGFPKRGTVEMDLAKPCGKLIINLN